MHQLEVENGGTYEKANSVAQKLGPLGGSAGIPRATRRHVCPWMRTVASAIDVTVAGDQRRSATAAPDGHPREIKFVESINSAHSAAVLDEKN